jgi:hypothetical protein
VLWSFEQSRPYLDLERVLELLLGHNIVVERRHLDHRCSTCPQRRQPVSDDDDDDDDER